MRTEVAQKITASHLRRDAYLYIRQSSLHQVLENTESTQRQYALRQRAVALGWPLERVVVIDSDQGQSGASVADREGFLRLVSDVGLGRAGIVMGLEVSRLARNCTDWHRLLEICALAETLILDEDGLYDPQQFNDRLLLGLKGTMSEAELHLLRARLRGGILSKAKRGALPVPLPVGLVYDAQGEVAFDPDQQVQESLRALFATFRRTGSAWRTVKFFRQEGLRFPRRLRKGARKGDLVWDSLRHSRALQVLHNPRYAGAFFFGRTHTRKTSDGKTKTERLPQAEWHALLLGAHVGYITWEEYEENQRRIRESAPAYGLDRRHGPPREGPALLQGLVLCGRCGRRMTVRYHQQNNQLVPGYACSRDGIEHGRPFCQSIPGAAIDAAIGQWVVEAMTPLALEVALTVQQELQSRREEADHLRQQQIERARYEAELARRRYMQVDPDHRLVADSLEAEWNEKLRALAEAQEEYERAREADHAPLSEEQRQQIMALASDFPRLWQDPKTAPRERKRMLRLLIEDVTLLKDRQITAHVRFRGGKTTTLTLPLPKPAWALRQTDAEVIREIDRLLNDYTDAEIAARLNENGRRSGCGKLFSHTTVTQLRYKYNLKSRYQRLREGGLLTLEEVALRLKVHRDTVKRWHRHGLLVAHPYNDKHECLYEPPGPDSPTRAQGRKLSERLGIASVALDRTQEVQYEA